MKSIFIEDKGNVGALRDISTGLEAYLRKLSYFSGLVTIDNMEEYGLLGLFKILTLNKEAKKKGMKVVGINFGEINASACLINHGAVVSAAWHRRWCQR